MAHRPDTPGLTWRPLTTDDLVAWHGLVRAIEAADEPAERYAVEDLEDELVDGSWKDPERDSLVALDAAGTPVAFGLVEDLPSATMRRAVLWGGVHPAHRGRGLGRELLRWQRERAGEMVAVPVAASSEDVDPAWREDVAWRMQLSHLERQEDRQRLARAAGMREVRWFHDLVRPLTTDDAAAVPDVPVPAGLRVVPFESADSERMRLAHNEAFAGHWGSQPRSEEAWRHQLVDQRNFRPDWTFLAVDPSRTDPDGRPEVAGYVTGAAFEQDWEAQGYTQGWTGLLGVRPGWRGRRLAPALLAVQLRAFAAAGMQTGGLDVDTGNASGALALYTGMGYRVEHTSVVWAVEG